MKLLNLLHVADGCAATPHMLKDWGREAAVTLSTAAIDSLHGDVVVWSCLTDRPSFPWTSANRCVSEAV